MGHRPAGGGGGGAGELGTLRIGYSLSAGAETAPALVDKLIRRSPGLEVGAVPMATPEISPAVADGRIDAGITRGEQPGRGVRRYLLRRARIGVQLAQHHPLAEHSEIEIAAAAAYPLRLPDRAASSVIHDRLAALFRDTRPHPRFHTPTVSFDMSQGDLHNGLTPRPGRRGRRHGTTARHHLATASRRTQPDDPPGPSARTVATTPPRPYRRQNPGARAALAVGLTGSRSCQANSRGGEAEDLATGRLRDNHDDDGPAHRHWTTPPRRNQCHTRIRSPPRRNSPTRRSS
ncbi:LysR substrate-binding domain-containing protein [Streptomyces pseudovenezuelae]|uniref:LysR substrate-binding domain-containing protein n=1 Tax=Streptomyces pseudovenezuelae TaxID=67350 RepID=UPI002E3598CF|nr:LysR substrate-binding domain-containing protein [Streptomyces pseudovenezuelae]